MNLFVISINEPSRLADTFWVFTGDDVQKLEIQPTHESFDIVEIFEIEDKRCFLFIERVSSFRLAESFASCSLVVFALSIRDFECVRGHGRF